MIFEIGLQVFAAAIGDRPGADEMLVVGVHVGQLRPIVVGKLLDLARADPGALVARRAIDLEAAQPLVDISDEARLAHFAVVDDVDADFDLLAHDVGDGLAHARLVTPPRRSFRPCARATLMAWRSAGRGRLPTWVVRMRSALCRMAFGSRDYVINWIVTPPAGEFKRPARVPPRLAALRCDWRSRRGTWAVPTVVHRP